MSAATMNDSHQIVDPEIVNETTEDDGNELKPKYEELDDEMKENFKIMENYLRVNKCYQKKGLKNNIYNDNNNNENNHEVENVCDNDGEDNDDDVDYISDEKAGMGNMQLKTLTHADGTTSTYFDKRKLKIAPRSTLQFKVGPSFELIGNYNEVFDLKNSSKKINFQLIPRIDRGFDYIEEEWVGYKRNYFTLVSSFDMDGKDFNQVLKSSYLLKLYQDGTNNNIFRKIKYFAIKIKAMSDEDFSEINLIQHTAKRDKGPQSSPQLCPVIPSPLPKHQIIREASNVRNIAKKKKYDSTFYFHREQNLDGFDIESLVNSYPNDCIQKVARFERIQFASSINVKNPPQKNKYFRLHVILGAVIDGCEFPSDSQYYSNYENIGMNNGSIECFVPLQEMRTPQLIIRGRSPSNYTSYNKTNTVKEKLQSQNLSQLIIQKKVLNKISKSTIENNENIQKNNLHFKPLIDNEVDNKENIAPYFETKINCQEFKPRSNKRVITLGQIEEIILQENAATMKNSTENTLNYLNKKLQQPELDLPRPVYSRHYSIDPRDIDLKFEDMNVQEDNYIVGSLIMHNVQLPNTIRDGTEITDANTIRTILTTPCTTATIAATRSVPMRIGTSLSTNVKKTAYHLSNNFDTLNSSFDFESSSNDNYGDKSTLSYSEHINNINAGNLSNLRSLENIPRLFNKGKTEKSFTSLQNDKILKYAENSASSTTHNLKLNNSVTLKSKLPSQLNDTRELYSEPSFYNH
ncbi:hypothetical protein TPHA_0I01370 [Tetrapisispora phaffii CBS 4417]|uniref:NDT80 domain-containing protein n=1 Tax=Tetrapisispora phaffii (strain ATCC 24235 / CBS 4417 / NBRC 1672 / NRRL Y-8282 / UCD 70-5) TaxID=1071381 RepID=G8BXL5_TETPH|nr:hypothetical protein TPHA_0I01370 [Tetrapisispora phaffii CBS 4417]CCE64643.1 hypothetical protein TPHA_0I01370 [Tetrapisispora phaffii CBS 4417]